MTILLVVIHVIVCLILILVILLQAGRGQGLTGPSFASGNVQSLFGTRAGDFLTKATSVAAICFLLTCITLDVLESRKSRSLLEGIKQPAPIDMEAIKKALEEAKSKEAGKKEATHLIKETNETTAKAQAAVTAASLNPTEKLPVTSPSTEQKATHQEVAAPSATAAVSSAVAKATGEPSKP